MRLSLPAMQLTVRKRKSQTRPWQRVTSLPSAFSLCMARHRAQRTPSSMSTVVQGSPHRLRHPERHGPAGADHAAVLPSGTGVEAGGRVDGGHEERDRRLPGAAGVGRGGPRSSLPPGTNVIPVKWVFKIKTDENGQSPSSRRASRRKASSRGTAWTSSRSSPTPASTSRCAPC